MKPYGKELILDMHLCDPKTMNRDIITKYFKSLCKKINVEPCDLHFWDDVGVPKEERQTDPRLVGTSAIQFILTSNITVHALPLMKTVYLNIFSCDEFNEDAVMNHAVRWFKSKKVVQMKVMDRI